MKRLTAAVTGLILLVAFTINVHAQTMYIKFDNSAIRYNVRYFSLKINGNNVQTEVPPVLLGRILMVPVLSVFESLGADPVWDSKTGTVTVKYNGSDIQFTNKSKIAVVNGEKTSMEAPARLVNQRLMVPLSFFSDRLGMTAEWSTESDVISIIDPSVPNQREFELERIGYSANGGLFTASIELSGYMSHYDFRLTNPDRIVVDFSGAKGPEYQQIMDVGIHPVKSIRYAQFENRLRVVFDVEGQPEYSIEQKGGTVLVYIGDIAGKDIDRGNETDDDDTVDRGGYDRDRPVLEGLVDVMHVFQGEKDEISIPLKDYKGYSIMRLSGPDRIVIDIPNTKASTINKAINTKGSLIRNIRCAQFTESIARVVLDVIGQPQYEVKEENGLLRLYIEKPTYRNVEYRNNGDRVCLILNGAKLTEGAADLKKLYTASYDPTGLRYTVTFPSNLAKLENGVLKINDSYVDTIVIKTDKSTGKTSITFNGKDKFVYHTITRQSENDTAITILKPAKKNERLVVIDPGHGGSESGAVAGGVYEKDLNLDIALRLNELLKAKGVKTYMIREDDSYVGLYERSYIANNLNATLFLSIHNNAINNPDYAGTMTLYLPPGKNTKGFTSMRFAQIIQEHLVGTLRSIDRKIIPRPELVVLKATDMHAALAEVGFMTNKKELSNLMKATYRQNAAKALCQAVIQALEEDD